MATRRVSQKEVVRLMVALLLALLLVVLLFGVGFAVHILWWVALAALVLWAAGWLLRGGSGGRWYRW